MSHAGIDTLVDDGAEIAKHLGRLVHARERNVRVGIAAAQKDRRASERAGVVARRAGWTDDAGAQPGNGGVAARMARGELERETTALREPDERDAFGRDTLAVEIADERVERAQRGRQKGLVLRDRRQERVRIPRASTGLWRQVRDVAAGPARQRRTGCSRPWRRVHAPGS